MIYSVNKDTVARPQSYGESEMQGYDLDLIVYDTKGKRISTTSRRVSTMGIGIKVCEQALQGIMDTNDVRTVSLTVSRVEDDNGASSSSQDQR